MFPKIGGKPPKSSILIGFSSIFTIHFGGKILLFLVQHPYQLIRYMVYPFSHNHGFVENGGLEDDDLVSFWGGHFPLFISFHHFSTSMIVGRVHQIWLQKNQLLGIHQIWIKKPNHTRIFLPFLTNHTGRIQRIHPFWLTGKKSTTWR